MERVDEPAEFLDLGEEEENPDPPTVDAVNTITTTITTSDINILPEPPKNRPVVFLPEHISFLVNHESESLTGCDSAVDESETRTSIIQQLLDLLNRSPCSTSWHKRWDLVKDILVVLRITRLSTSTKSIWVQKILNAWSDSEECDHWINTNIFTLVPFLLELAPGVFEPPFLYRLKWALTRDPQSEKCGLP